MMIKNFFKTAIRNLTKRKGYAFINMLGLAMGMGVCLFLVLLNQYAFQVDGYHENGERIYRLADKVKTQSGSVVDAAITPAPWGEAIAQNYPGVEEYVRFSTRSEVVQKDEKIFRYGVTHTDSSVFRVFTYPLKWGDPETALKRPNSVVLSEHISEVYFGTSNPVGETLILDDISYEVTGVLQKIPDKSSIFFDLLVPYSSQTEAEYPELNNLTSHNQHTYFLLRNGTDPKQVEAGLQDFIVSQFGEEGLERYQPYLQPYESMYLHSDLFAEHGETLDITYVYIFSAIAFLILLIACVNFVNMATARGLERSREVGVRKVIGAGKQQLVVQFLAEALLLSGISVFLSLMLVELALPWFNNLTEWTVEVEYLTNHLYQASVIAVVLVVGLLAGAYPAFFLSSFQPARVLKGDRSSGMSRSMLRRVLVVVQFGVAIFLIIGTRVVDNQLEFLANKELGFETNNIMVTSMTGELRSKDPKTVRNILAAENVISEIAMSSNIPGDASGSKMRIRPEGQFESDEILVSYYSVDEHFLNLFDIELRQGRNFNPEFASDSLEAFLINEAAAREFGWENPVGKTIETGSDEPRKASVVIGVTEDFHFESLHNRIRPLLLQYHPDDFGAIAIKLQTSDISAEAKQIAEFLRQFNAGLPVGYWFLDSDIAQMYNFEEIIGEMLRYFTYLTLFIACMGLLGLASYTINQRKKEIGIRKVMGASVSSILKTLGNDFVRLVILGFLIAAPLAYFLLNWWLQSFAYRTEIGVLTFIAAGLLTVILTVVTIGFHSWRAAVSNPVDSLRSE